MLENTCYILFSTFLTFFSSFCNHSEFLQYPSCNSLGEECSLRIKDPGYLFGMRDEDVMKLVKNGKLDALSILFDRYHLRLFNFFLRLIDDRNLSEDLVQNVFERIIKYRSSYREGASVKTWIYQIARNVRIDHFRAQKWHKEEFAEIENEEDGELSSQLRLEREEEIEALDLAIQSLPLSYREVLWLGHFEELSYREVGDILGISIPNVKVRMHRAVKQLKNMLNPSTCR